MKTSIEILTHYQCPDCEQWWSIGDAPPFTSMYCPLCGASHLVKDVPTGEALARLHEERITNLQRAVDYANDCVDMLAAENKRLRAEEIES